MTLRDNILNSPETISDLAWAAEQRFREAEVLMDARHITGAVYLLGLAAEMWLKTACFRSFGAGLSTPIATQLGPARVWMRQQAPAIDAESYHSLQFWAEYLIQKRALTGIPLATEVTGRLRHHVTHRLFADWKVDIRYRLISMSELHSNRVYNDVVWIRREWTSLWR